MVDVKKKPSLKQHKKKLLIAGLALVIVVAGGLYYWQQRQTKTPAPEAAAAAKVTYVEITDWGIKFPVTSEHPDAYYNNKTASPIARGLVGRFLNTESGCTDQPIAIIYRVPKDDQNPQAKGKKYVDSEKGKVIDEYFYFVRNATQTCPSNKDSQARLDKLRAEFLAAAPTIEKTK